MDPDANLTEQLDLAADLLRLHESRYGTDEGTPPTEAELIDAARLAELVQALDAWLTGGGCLPQRWRQTKAT
jgi:hypothetical protein